jgi:lipopolysaccharide transport system ATP-binding protein
MLAVEARDLSKAYRLYARPRDRLLERLRRGGRHATEIWALKAVSFVVAQGSTLGVIGDNGAGKSTLLQLLARTLRPTGGSLTVVGRVSAILELGAGYHPEFTGRENVFMAGAILGFSPAEMTARLDAIASFAELGEFFDRPVKTYSSGMFLRLAFSVATSVDPDVLVIDEFLSVGDQYFQKKCIDRIAGFRNSGKTIVFCSHNLYQVRLICDQTLWLSDGEVRLLGPTTRVVDAYESAVRQRMERPVAPASAPAPGRAVPTPRSREAASAGHPLIKDVRLLDAEGTPGHEFQTGRAMRIAVSYEVPQPPTRVHVGVSIFRNDGVQCFATATHVEGMIPPGESAVVTLRLPRLPLMAGEYEVSAYLLDDSGLHSYDQRERDVRFRVHRDLPAIGLVYLEHEWEMAGPVPLSVVAAPEAEGPWSELCEQALSRHSPRGFERLSLDGDDTVGHLLERMHAPFVAVVHPAVAVGPGWADGLIRALEETGAGAAGPVAMGAPVAQRLAASYQDATGFLETAARQTARGEPPRTVESLEPFCFVAPRRALARLEPSTPVLQAPAALRASGQPLVAVPSVVVHPFTGYFCQERPELADRVPAEARAVLDVGCGTGALGRRLKQTRTVRVVGIERDTAAAAAARAELDDVIECDLDRALPPLASDSFDCLIFADVLEHLNDPWGVLRGLVRCLRPGGTVLACLPNVRHWSVLRGLLEGHWRYAPAGLLDQGHLRFFTRRTSEELLTGAGLVLRSVEPLCDEASPDLTRIARLLESEGLRVESLAEEAQAVQFLYVAQRPSPPHGG